MTSATNLWNQGVARVAPYVPRLVRPEIVLGLAAIVSAVAAIVLLGKLFRALFFSAPKNATPTERTLDTKPKTTPASPSTPAASATPNSPETPVASPAPQPTTLETPPNSTSAATVSTSTAVSPGMGKLSVLRYIDFGVGKSRLSVAIGDAPRGSCVIQMYEDNTGTRQLWVCKPKSIDKTTMTFGNHAQEETLLLTLLEKLNSLNAESVYLTTDETGGWLTFGETQVMTIVQTCIQQNTNKLLKNIYLIFPNQTIAEKALKTKPFVSATATESSQPVGVKIQIKKLNVQIECGEKAQETNKRCVVDSRITSDNQPEITATRGGVVESYKLTASYDNAEFQETLTRISARQGTKITELVFHMDNAGCFSFTNKIQMMEIIKAMAQNSVFQNAGIQLVRVIFPNQQVWAEQAQQQLISK